jgi:PAP2 superfamily
MAPLGVSQTGARPVDAERPARRRALRAPSALAAPHPGVWAVTAALAAADAIWLAATDIAIEPAGFLGVAAMVAVLLAAARLWGRTCPEPTLRGMALSTASLMAFTVSIALFHYLAATLDRPFIDEALARAEALLGFDWPAHRAFLKAHPDLAWWLALAYHSSGPQIAVVVIVLSALRRLGRLWAFVRLFAVSLCVVIAVSAFFPARGPYAAYAHQEAAIEGIETIGATWHLEPLARLRGATAPVIALGDIRGLATFPSFHVCLAVITAWALAIVPVLGPLAVLLNAAVVVATLGAGGHYLPDVLAGGLLALALVARQSRAGRLTPRRHPSAGRAASRPRSWRIRSAVMRAPS